MRELFRTIRLLARADLPVMIAGESGSGRAHVAKAIHLGSARAGGPFVRVSCSVAEAGSLVRELFGEDPRGESAGHPGGRVGEALGGTLLLTEICDLPLPVQLKLLDVVKRQELQRAAHPHLPVRDVRLVCTTHRDMRRTVADGRFRRDLFYRLNALTVSVPPLRERLEDVRSLAEALTRPSGVGGRARAISAAALAAMEAYGWPGNVRELKDALAHAALEAGDGDIAIEHLPPALRERTAGRGRRPAGEDLDALIAALMTSNWNRTEAARLLGISRVTLWKRIQRFGLSEPR